MSENEKTFDYVIVGSGSAGSILASRLSESGKYSVLVLEYGGTDIGPLIQMPSALSYPMNMARYDWGYQTEPEPNLNNRRLVCPRGKVIGGSSSINGMVYVRGHACDYDTWEEMGASGWGYRHVLPYFKRMETSHGGQEGWRGTDGPMHITRGKRKNPLFHAFVKAGEEAGYETTEDYNGEQQEGFGAFEMTVYKGRRWSTANAYLKPALKRSNLSLVTGAKARRVLFDGKKAVGVEYEKNGRVQSVKASREVILSSSSINSPALLQLSGVGNAEQLKDIGVDVVHHLPGVGENLQDHLEVYFQIACKQPITLYKHLNIFSKAWIGAQWLFTKTGLGATNHFESTAFIRSRAGIKYPDLQYHFLPVAIRYDGKAPAEGHGFQCHVGPMRSKSRGSVKITSNDPNAAPKIFFNYMSHEDDWTEWRTALRLTREVLAQSAMEPFYKHEIQPGIQIQSDDELDGFVREHAESAFHPSGTCKMGAVTDPMAVVDPECRVIGLENLRVVDVSILPQITNGNLNGPTLMLAEKACDHILGKDPLPASNQEPWIHPDWENSQR
ncbi:choline dehydrogenase [Alphaproteobacteria bacterium]|nr:choline dehydrogenase [Alphaproteobacteria bacterium]